VHHQAGGRSSAADESQERVPGAQSSFPTAARLEQRRI
jgi:hypothetical protein